MDLLRKDREQELMIQTAEAVGDVPLYEPSRSFPRLPDLRKRGVAASAWSKIMGSVAELRLIVRLKYEANYTLVAACPTRWGVLAGAFCLILSSRCKCA